MDSDPSKEYEVQGVIGSGSFGLIRKVIRKRDNMVRLHLPPTPPNYAIPVSLEYSFVIFSSSKPILLGTLTSGLGEERNSLLEDVGEGETTIDTRSEYPRWTKTSAYREILFQGDCEGGRDGVFIYGVLS